MITSVTPGFWKYLKAGFPFGDTRHIGMNGCWRRQPNWFEVVCAPGIAAVVEGIYVRLAIPLSIFLIVWTISIGICVSTTTARTGIIVFGA
jgi:hypothetical protein